jgi:enoyl-[acyl-carrier protein] reductase/trans-2-enoyl-CoA reductase (NAD+)
MLKVSHGDAFSDEIKKETLALIKADLGQVDLIIYNSFSVRKHPVTGVLHRCVKTNRNYIYEKQ